MHLSVAFLSMQILSTTGQISMKLHENFLSIDGGCAYHLHVLVDDFFFQSYGPVVNTAPYIAYTVCVHANS